MKLLIGIIASALGLEARGFQTGIKENGERSCSCIGDPDWCADFCSGSGGNGGDNGSCSCVGDPQWCEDFCNGNGGGNGGGISDPEVIMKSTLSDCGWYNWSMVKCATEMHDRIQRNTGNQYSQGCAFASNFKMRSDANAKISQKHFAKRCECEKISKSFCEAMRNFANFRKMRVFAKCELSQNASFSRKYSWKSFFIIFLIYVLWWSKRIFVQYLQLARNAHNCILNIMGSLALDNQICFRSCDFEFQFAFYRSLINTRYFSNFSAALLSS